MPEGHVLRKAIKQQMCLADGEVYNYYAMRVDAEALIAMFKRLPDAVQQSLFALVCALDKQFTGGTTIEEIASFRSELKAKYGALPDSSPEICQMREERDEEIESALRLRYNLPDDAN
jgi:hypothetical protein